jgi:hypothetical protein
MRYGRIGDHDIHRLLLAAEDNDVPTEFKGLARCGTSFDDQSHGHEFTPS